MTYLDTSSFLKLFIEDAQTFQVQEVLGATDSVIISSCVYLECLIQFKARQLGGDYNLNRMNQFIRKLDSLLEIEPFWQMEVSGNVFPIASKQVLEPESVYLRPMDQIHLAAMEELGISNLITNDKKQAEAARALGYNATIPV